MVGKRSPGLSDRDTVVRLVDAEGWLIIDADAAVLAGRTPPSTRIPLDRGRILAAAITCTRPGADPPTADNLGTTPA